MPTSPILLLPYPAPTDPADVPTDLSELVTRVEAVRGAVNGLAGLGSDGKVPAAQLPPAASPGYARYRKSTAKTVNNTVVETDLFNGEITIAAGALGATGIARISAFGDVFNNSGATGGHRWKLKLGGTTLIDTGLISQLIAGTTRWGWRLRAEIANSAANVQAISFDLLQAINTGGGQASVVFTTGEGVYSWGAGAAGGYYPTALAIGMATAAKDTSVAQALELTVTHSAANANLETKLYSALVELIP